MHTGRTRVGGHGVYLHGYTRNTPSDTEVYAEHQLRADRRTLPVVRIYRTTQNSVDKETRGKTGVLVELDLPLASGGTEAYIEGV